jgi:chaperonin GroES
MAEKIRPLYDRVLVKRSEHEEKTAGGIIIPDTAKEKAQEGTIIAVGKGRITKDGEMFPLAVKAGDVVYFGKYAGTDLGNDFLIIREEEILGIVEK